MNSLRKTIQIAPRFSSIIRTMSDKKPSSDSAGAVRAAGGAFAKLEVAHEEEYFYKQRQEQLHMLKEKKTNEEQFREKAIQDHEAAIAKHKTELDQLRKK